MVRIVKVLTLTLTCWINLVCWVILGWVIFGWRFFFNNQISPQPDKLNFVVNINLDKWMADMMKFLACGEMLDEEDRSKKVCLRVPRFEVKEGRMYKRSYGGPLLRCVDTRDARKIMDEVHESMCTTHQGADTLYRRILLLGYYWPSMRIHCKEKVRACKIYQVFANASCETNFLLSTS